MKGKLIAFAGILCIASLMVSGANAGKPEKPGNQDKTQTELIMFSELEGGTPDGSSYLYGVQEVEGCCPNAGPFPEYTLFLSDAENFPSGTYDGQLFMNSFREGKNRMYKVQFWTEGDDHICIEIYGGVPDYDKKTKVLTVTFEDVDWNLMHDPEKILWD